MSSFSRSLNSNPDLLLIFLGDTSGIYRETMTRFFFLALLWEIEGDVKGSLFPEVGRTLMCELRFVTYDL